MVPKGDQAPWPAAVRGWQETIPDFRQSQGRAKNDGEFDSIIEETFGGMYSPSPGVIYPTLSMLEELGHILPQAVDGTKKAYAATEAGKAFLAGNRPAVDRVPARMATPAQAFGSGPAPEILRAMHNLRLALRTRLGRGPLDAEQIRCVTGALDRAAGEVERS
jgi:DNA-binding PadR family transcriptional regulator